MKFVATIEISKGSSYKYEFDKQSQTLKLDRVLSIPCPENYGFIKNTLSGDGDPLDIFIVSQFPITALTQVEFDILGILICDDNGFEDNKVIAKIKGDIIHTYKWLMDIEYYLKNYKTGFTIKDYKLLDSNDDLEKYLTT